MSGASTLRKAMEADQPFRPQENDEQGTAGASAGLEAESDAAEIARLLPPRRWSLDIFERNPWLRPAEFRIREAAKRTKFPFRALRPSGHVSAISPRRAPRAKSTGPCA